MKAFRLMARDGYPLSIHSFDVETPKAVIQIIHGMEEHQKRYEPFIHFLNQNGYSVVSSDLRGHGPNAEVPGFFKEKRGYVELIGDQIKIRKFIAKRYPQTPVYLFAHSMGTVIARVLLQTQSKQYEKVVLSGYPNYRWQADFGLLLSSILKLLKGPKYKSALLEYASIGIFNKEIENPSSDIDWISSNPDNIKAYAEDPLCGAGFSCSAFHDLFRLLTIMHKPDNYKEVHRRMPILMLRGLDDPCTGGNKGSWDSFATLSVAGFSHIIQTDYPNMRHEILNECNCHKVYDDILKFFDATSLFSI